MIFKELPRKSYVPERAMYKERGRCSQKTRHLSQVGYFAKYLARVYMINMGTQYTHQKHSRQQKEEAVARKKRVIFLRL
eukprot:scaffold2511_cov153-Skeletonema_menzelii.AAC.5